MPSTYTSLRYHLIISTKNREPAVAPSFRARLHEYLGGAVHGLEAVPMGVGGTMDHVHLLIGLKPTHCLADFVRDLKKTTSVWMTEACGAEFYWQEGYAAFSVSASLCPAVQDYIANQEEHHRRKTFREELEEFLSKSSVAYDARYLE